MTPGTSSSALDTGNEAETTTRPRRTRVTRATGAAVTSEELWKLVTFIVCSRLGIRRQQKDPPDKGTGCWPAVPPFFATPL